MLTMWLDPRDRDSSRWPLPIQVINGIQFPTFFGHSASSDSYIQRRDMSNSWDHLMDFNKRQVLHGTLLHLRPLHMKLSCQTFIFRDYPTNNSNGLPHRLAELLQRLVVWYGGGPSRSLRALRKEGLQLQVRGGVVHKGG